MIKRFVQFLFVLLFCTGAFAQTAYNAIATAYVTTTITQAVVFDSTMQQGGTFTMSVLAHNGGGRAGQSDTANVKIQFYTASNVLVTQVNSTYNANLPNPNAVCGNPCIDTSVPWSTLTVSATLSAAQASTVAYAKVSMYGIDGSYWAGDYGPWYRAPTFQLNGGGNLLYNPEFGPYNNITAQGWTSSPGFGACQGAWGGSNACIVNSDGVPGSSTAGLVANANGGGPSATGGTTSGTPGGYNSTMSVTNAGTGATAGAPARTVTSTTTTTQTKTIISGRQQILVTTPVTVTNYSDGTSTTSSGTATNTTLSATAFTGAHFGRAQVADTQWDVYACTQTSTCNIYSTSPGGTYQTGSWTPISSTQYITFIPNTGADSASNPWIMILVNADGTYTALGSGRILVQGVDTSGNIYLFFSNDNFNGTLLSGNLGLSGQGVTFTGTQNPTASDTNTLSSNMSANPLAPGQTGGTPIPPRPPFDGTITITNGSTITYSDTNTGLTSAQQNRVNNWNNTTQSQGNGIKLDVNGSNNTVYIEQVGNNNTVQGNGGAAATLYGDSNHIKISQGTAGSGQNMIKMDVTGTNNAVGIRQARDETGVETGTNGHYQSLIIGGFGNVVNTIQNNTTLGGQYMETTVNGNGNNVLNKQLDNGNKIMFTTVSGNNNSVTATQQGTGQHQLTTNLTGNNNSAIVVQDGAQQNRANIDLTNAGGPATLDLQQSGGKNFTIIQSCTNPAGCSTTVRQ
jgi:hypothetical protein